MFLIPNDKDETKRPDVEVVAKAIRDRLEESRFTARVEYYRSHPRCRRMDAVKIECVRLRRKKDYCGQHPNACPVTFVQKKHKRTSYLEGADWVGLNDMINDLCDERNWSADFWSTSPEFKGRLFVRSGRLRRVSYPSIEVVLFGVRAINLWDTSDAKKARHYYDDYCGRKAPKSEYAYGTPGLAEWKKDSDLEYAEADHGH